MKDFRRLGFDMASLKRVFGSTWGRVAIALSVAAAVVIGSVPAQAVVQITRTTQIVRVQTGADAQVREALSAMAKLPIDEIDFVFDGFIVKLADFEIAQLRANPLVVDITPDETVSLLETDSPTPSWGLDRVDQPALPLDSSFTYPTQGGAGVRAYIVDTGVQADNPDFAGRIAAGFDAFGANGQNVDCHGHGTHVAGTVAGTKYGLAKKATIVPVKVLSCAGSGSYSGIISALDWIRANHPAGTPGVVNMSIGGPTSSSITTAVDNLTAAGILSVVAAGNSNTDACTSSPASAPQALTVGATSQTDGRASFSNFGNCVDIFAPGVSIVSDDAFAAGGSRSMSGTSMASPHAAGVAALLLGQNPTFTPAQVVTALMDNAKQGVVTNALSNNSGLLNIQFLNATTPPPAPIVGVPDAPTGVAVTSITKSAANVGWIAPANDGGATVTGYKVEYRSSATAAWQTVGATTNSAAISGLTSASNYQVQVRATNSVGDSLPSAIVNFTTLGDLPGAPTNPTATNDRGNAFTLGWTAPASNGGNAITSYPVQQLQNGNWVQIGSGSASSRTFNVTNLTPGTAYSFRISASNINGTGPYVEFNYTTGILAPSTPTGVTVSAIGPRTATASWNPVNPPTAGVPLVYEVTWGWSGYSTVLGRATGLTSPSYTMANLAASTRYWVQVTAAQGTAVSLPSSKVYFATTANVPNAPAMNTTVRNGSKATINWSPTADGGSPIIDYTLQSMQANVSGATWTDVASGLTATSYEVDMPAIGQSIYYRVAARNAIGLGAWSLQTLLNSPAGAPGAPTNLSGAMTGNTLNLTWTAPTETGGVALRDYRVQLSRDNGATWVDAVFTTASTIGVAAPAKGQTWLYRVAARNASQVQGTYSAVYSFTREAGKANSPRISSARISGTSVVIAWFASTDNGGSAITSYRVETRTGNSGDWTLATLVAGNTLNATFDAPAPGSTLAIRVSAENSAGPSDPSSAVTLVVPAKLADAPSNLSGEYTSSNNRVALSWTPPANNGGSAIRQYVIQYSNNGGTTWYTGAYALASATSYLAGFVPAKGASYSYRIYVQTSAGNSPYSNVVVVNRTASVPGAPSLTSPRAGTDGKLSLTWVGPSDNGGSAITGYVVESNTSNAGWQEVANLDGAVRTVALDKATPGVSTQYRVVAINSIGRSATSNTVTYTSPLVKAGAPTNFALNQDPASAARLVATWVAPADRGGASSISYYLIEYSVNGGTTWSNLTSASGSATSVLLGKPAKGVTMLMRISAYTGAGKGEVSNIAQFSSAATAPSAPYGTRVIFGSDGNPVVSWYRSSDNGGSALTGYRVEQNIANAGWTLLANVDGVTLSAVGTRAARGVTTQFRVFATNAVGTSTASSTAAIMVPFDRPSAPQDLTALPAGTNTTVVTLRWAAPTDLGGATSTQYRIERSLNSGSNWQFIGSTSALQVNVSGPAKGTSAQYRVAATTGYGIGEYTAAVNFTAAVTVPSTPSMLSPVLDTAASTVVLAWRAPSDNGGSVITGYRVDKFDNSQWSTIATVDGATFTVTTPMSAPGMAIGYRVYAINSAGVSSGYGYTSARMPYAPPATPSITTAVVTSTNASSSRRLNLGWTVSSFGGSSLSSYQIQVSTDGGNGWTPIAIAYSTSWVGTAPAAGTSVQYRVVVRTSAGLTSTSAAVTVTG